MACELALTRSQGDIMQMKNETTRKRMLSLLPFREKFRRYLLPLLARRRRSHTSVITREKNMRNNNLFDILY